MGVELLRLGLNSRLPLRDRVAFGALERFALGFGRIGETSREALGEAEKSVVEGFGVVEERAKVGAAGVDDEGVSFAFLSGPSLWSFLTSDAGGEPLEAIVFVSASLMSSAAGTWPA